MPIVLIFILFASLFRGGNRHVPLIGLEWLALLVLLALGARSLIAGRLPGGLGIGAPRSGLLLLATAPLWVALLQLVVWPGLSGTAATPEATWASTLAGLTLSAFFLTGLSAQSGQTDTLLKIWMGVAVAQATLGLIQLSGAEALRFELFTAEPVIGTFASKNTFANFLVMAVPLVIHRLVDRSTIGRASIGRGVWLWGSALFVLLASVIASASRTGIATGLLVGLLAVALLPCAGRTGEGVNKRHRGSRLGLVGGAVVLLLLVLLAGGLDWVERFDGERLVADNATRALMREATWQGAMAYWPWGSGMGSYPVALPRFQPPELGRHLIDLAHNDYLQALMEMGAAFVVIAGVALALIARRLMRMGRAALEGRQQRGSSRSTGAMGNGVRLGWSRAGTLAPACGLGALATALHALVDYPLHIPANAMMAAFLLGVFLREPLAKGEDATPKRHRRLLAEQAK